MIQLKRAKRTALTTQMIFESETVNQLRSNIALGLLTGGFNSLKYYSVDRRPIDLYTLKILQEKFNDLISEVESEMSINIMGIETF